MRGITRGRVGHASRRSLSAVVGFAVAAALAATLSPAASSLAASSATAKCGGTGSATTVTGKFADGATYLMQCPPGKWNGTLLLYSHGYVVPGGTNPAEDVSDPITSAWMLANGFAMAGSSYASTGWAIQKALPDQVSTLNAFKSKYGNPHQTIAWGDSLGGIITAGLIQDYPKLFTAALPMCGVLSGGIATWNTALDAELVFQQLVPGGTGLQLVNITNPTANLQLAEKLITAAQKTKVGQARLALGAALADTPGWFTPLSKQPAFNAWTAKEANQYEWFTQVDLPFVFDFRANLEADAGGNPSWTTGVNFKQQLESSADYREVVALYRRAGLNLTADLNKLSRAPRIKPDGKAVAYLAKNISFNGDLSVPVLSVHTTGDGLVVPENEQAYKTVVDKAGHGALLRQIFVHRAGHCAFTPADTIASLKVLLNRVKTGRWDASALTTASLNASAKALGAGYNIYPAQNGKCPVGKPVFGICPTPPAFTNYTPLQYPRPFDLGDPVPGSSGA